MNPHTTKQFQRQLLSGFFGGDIRFFTLGLSGLPKVYSRILQKECFKTPQSKISCNSVPWIHTSQSSMKESFFLFLWWGYSVFHNRPQWAPKCPFCFQTAESKGSFNSVWWIHASQSCFMKTFSLVFIWKQKIFFTIRHKGLRNVHRQIQQKKPLPTCWFKRKV